MNKNYVAGIIIAAGLVLVFALDRLQPEKEIPHVHDHETIAPAPAIPASPSSARLGRGVNRGNLGRLNINVPPGWIQESPTSSMRIAQYRLPGDAAGSGDAEMAVFDRIGGTARQNIDRWIGQFTQPDGRPSNELAEMSQLTAGIVRVDRVHVQGTYSAGLMAGSAAQQPDYSLIGYIVNLPEGPYYFKAVGPTATMDYWTRELDAFIGHIEVAG